MTIKDLIKNKNYDCIDIRATPPKGWKVENMLIGYCKSEDGELISLDDDTYDEYEDIISSEEWKNEKVGVMQGLTVVIQGKWI